MDSIISPVTQTVPPPDYLPKHWFPRLLLSIALLALLFCIQMWNMPASFTQSEVRARIAPFMNYSGLAQGWGMFAPEPGRDNFYMSARITYADGRQNRWYIGRQDLRNNWQRLIGERERKMLEGLYVPANGTPYYANIALWAARKNNHYPNNPPVKVELMRHWSFIPPPPLGIDEPPTTTWQTDTVYTTPINVEAKR